MLDRLKLKLKLKLKQILIDGKSMSGSKTNEHKAAMELLGILPLAGRVMTGDAMLCPRDVTAGVIEGAGDYVLVAKDSQPGLVADIEAGSGFEGAPRPRLPEPVPTAEQLGRQATSVDEGHGRLEKRTLRATPILTADSGWKGLKQGFRVTRARTIKGDGGRGGTREHQPVGGAGRRDRTSGTGSGPLAHREPTALRSGCDPGQG